MANTSPCYSSRYCLPTQRSYSLELILAAASQLLQPCFGLLCGSSLASSSARLEDERLSALRAKVHLRPEKSIFHYRGGMTRCFVVGNRYQPLDWNPKGLRQTLKHLNGKILFTGLNSREILVREISFGCKQLLTQALLLSERSNACPYNLLCVFHT